MYYRVPNPGGDRLRLERDRIERTEERKEIRRVDGLRGSWSGGKLPKLKSSMRFTWMTVWTRETTTLCRLSVWLIEVRSWFSIKCSLRPVQRCKMPGILILENMRFKERLSCRLTLLLRKFSVPLKNKAMGMWSPTSKCKGQMHSDSPDSLLTALYPRVPAGIRMDNCTNRCALCLDKRSPFLALISVRRLEWWEWISIQLVYWTSHMLPGENWVSGMSGVALAGMQDRTRNGWMSTAITPFYSFSCSWACVWRAHWINTDLAQFVEFSCIYVEYKRGCFCRCSGLTSEKCLWQAHVL